MEFSTQAIQLHIDAIRTVGYHIVGQLMQKTVAKFKIK